MKKTLLVIMALVAITVLAQRPKPGGGSGGSSLTAGTDYAKPSATPAAKATIDALTCTSTETGKLARVLDLPFAWGRCNGSAWEYYTGFVLPPSTGWTSVNLDAATLTTTNGFRSLRDVDNLDEIHMEERAQPATPYTAIFKIATPYMSAVTAKFPFVGAGFCDAGTKIEWLAMLNNETSANHFPWWNVEKWNSTTSRASGTTSAKLQEYPTYIKATNNGTTMTLGWSYDGVNFESGISEAVATFMTPSKLCWGVRSNTSATQVVQVTLEGLLLY